MKNQSPTGRFSSDAPNMQDIPLRTEKARETQKVFYTAKFNPFSSEVEFRVVAHYKQERCDV